MSTKTDRVLAMAWNTIPHPGDDRRLLVREAAALPQSTKLYMLEGYLHRARVGICECKHSVDEIETALAEVRTK